MDNNNENTLNPFDYHKKDVITIRYEYGNLTPRQQYKIRDVVSMLTLSSCMDYILTEDDNTPLEKKEHILEECEKALIVFPSNLKDLELIVDTFQRILRKFKFSFGASTDEYQHRYDVLEVYEYFTFGSIGKEIHTLENDALKILPAEMKQRKENAVKCIDTIEKNLKTFCDMVSRNINSNTHYDFVNKHWLEIVQQIITDYYMVAREKLINPRCEYPCPDKKSRTYICTPFDFFTDKNKKNQKELNELEKINKENMELLMLFSNISTM